ncbi:MAG: hypothetical protein IPK52_04300 [Chloroflexi bacterium]|nr:hypothetical protein [Chloroflexota bacterium]
MEEILSTILSAIQSFFTWLINLYSGCSAFLVEAAQAIVTAITNLFILAADIARIIGEFITFIVGVINELVAIAVLIVQIIFAFFALLFGWLFQVVAIFVNFIAPSSARHRHRSRGGQSASLILPATTFAPSGT